MVVLLIGPHRCGKTSLASAMAQRVLNAKCFDLDTLIAEKQSKAVIAVFRILGPEGFTELCRQVVAEIAAANPDTLCFVAVGAGAFLAHDSAKQWLQDYLTVSLTGEPQELYPRADKTHFDRQEVYERIWYSPEMLALFGSAKTKVDVGSNALEESVEELLGNLAARGALPPEAI